MRSHLVVYLREIAYDAFVDKSPDQLKSVISAGKTHGDALSAQLFDNP